MNRLYTLKRAGSKRGSESDCRGHLFQNSQSDPRLQKLGTANPVAPRSEGWPEGFPNLKFVMKADLLGTR
jgi:hypothetical protein